MEEKVLRIMLEAVRQFLNMSNLKISNTSLYFEVKDMCVKAIDET